MIVRGIRVVLAVLMACWLVGQAGAQDAEQAGVFGMLYGDQVEETLTDVAFYDWWQFQANEGDHFYVEMTGSGGLEPLLGLLSPGGVLITRSDDGAADGTVSIEYTTELSGQFTLVATRAGNQDGTSTGSYMLRLGLVSTSTIGGGDGVPNYQDVVFECLDDEAANAFSVRFAEDGDQVTDQRITLFGLDGFQPVLRLELAAVEQTFCSQGWRDAEGNRYTLPGGTAVTIPDSALGPNTQHTIINAAAAGDITLTIGSMGEAPGRYMVVIDGFQITPGNDSDLIFVRLGPLASATTLDVYMVQTGNNRLDPYIRLNENQLACDDAGGRGCPDVPPLAGAGMSLLDGTLVKGDRFDAGVRLTPGTQDEQVLELGSFSGSTSGTYALIFIGTLPPRDLND